MTETRADEPDVPRPRPDGPLFKAGERVIIDAPGYVVHKWRGVVNEHRYVGFPLDQIMVGVDFKDGWKQWFLREQVRRIAGDDGDSKKRKSRR